MVTYGVICLLQKKKNPFFNLNYRFRTDGLGFVNNQNLENFYESSPETPSIVVDTGSDPDLSRHGHDSAMMVDKNNNIMNDMKTADNSHVIQYLSPPAFKRQRSTTESINTESTISRKNKRSHDAPFSR